VNSNRNELGKQFVRSVAYLVPIALVGLAVAAYAAGPVTVFTYDQAGNLLKISTPLPPIASASSPQTVPSGSSVTLNGGTSYDPNQPPLPLSYAWAQVAGPVVSINNATSATASFVASTPGAYAFTLTVANSAGLSSAASATVAAVDVQNDPANCGSIGRVCASPSHGRAVCTGGICGIVCDAGYTPSGSQCLLRPVAGAQVAQNVATGAAVGLSATSSYDPNQPPLPLSYAWTQSAGPAVTINGAASATATFVPSQPATYAFTLTVTNTGGLSATATVTTTAFDFSSDPLNCGSVARRCTALDVYGRARCVNGACLLAPVANAGPTQTLEVPSSSVGGTMPTVSLNGGASYDPNSPPATLLYSWFQVSGPSVYPYASNTAGPYFSAVPVAAGSSATLVFRLTVLSSNNYSTEATTSVVLTGPTTCGGGITFDWGDQAECELSCPHDCRNYGLNCVACIDGVACCG